jgi:O-antigen/teichoic acid export membrane protein
VPLGHLRRTMSSAGVYALASVAQSSLSFLLLPVYLDHLSAADYGVLELLSALTSILFAVLLVGLPSALTKVFHRDCRSESQRSRLLWTTLIVDLPVLVLGCGALSLFGNLVGRSLLGPDVPEAALMVRLVAANGVVASLVAIVLSSFRAQERATAYALLSVGQLLVNLMLNATFVAVLQLGVAGVLAGNLIANVAALPVALWWSRDRSRLAFDRDLVRPLLAFGLFIVPTALAGWINNLGDRYILNLFVEKAELGVYSLGYKIATVLHLGVVWPFQLAWPNVAFGIADDPEHRATFARTLSYLSTVLILGGVALSSAATALIPRLAPASYHGAESYVPWVTAGFAFYGVFYCVSPPLHLAGQTRLFPLFMGGSALLNLGLNLVLVPRLGGLGAAIATTASFAALGLATLAVAARLYRVQWEITRLAKAATAGIAGYASIPLTTRVDLSSPGILLLPPMIAIGLLLVLRFWTAGEIDAVRAHVARARRLGRRKP